MRLLALFSFLFSFSLNSATIPDHYLKTGDGSNTNYVWEVDLGLAPNNPVMRYNTSLLAFQMDNQDGSGFFSVGGGGGGGGGVSTFLGLTDTPSSYSGQGGLCAKVNLAESAIEYGACGAGSTDWLSLTDTPSSYVGTAGFFPRVTQGETGFELVDITNILGTGEPEMVHFEQVESSGVAGGACSAGGESTIALNSTALYPSGLTWGALNGNQIRLTSDGRYKFTCETINHRSGSGVARLYKITGGATLEVVGQSIDSDNNSGSFRSKLSGVVDVTGTTDYELRVYSELNVGATCKGSPASQGPEHYSHCTVEKLDTFGAGDQLFTSLLDTFTNYVGKAGQALVVNQAETGIESIDLTGPAPCVLEWHQTGNGPTGPWTVTTGLADMTTVTLTKASANCTNHGVTPNVGSDLFTVASGTDIYTVDAEMVVTNGSTFQMNLIEDTGARSLVEEGMSVKVVATDTSSRSGLSYNGTLPAGDDLKFAFSTGDTGVQLGSNLLGHQTDQVIFKAYIWNETTAGGGGGGGIGHEWAYITHDETGNVNAGSCAGLTNNLNELNTLVDYPSANTWSGVDAGSNEIDLLEAGRYRFMCWGQATKVGGMRVKLREVGGGYVSFGTPGHSDTGDNTSAHSYLTYETTIVSPTSYRLETFTTAANAGDYCLGNAAADGEPNKYAGCKIEKLD